MNAQNCFQRYHPHHHLHEMQGAAAHARDLRDALTQVESHQLKQVEMFSTYWKLQRSLASYIIWSPRTCGAERLKYW